MNWNYSSLAAWGEWAVEKRCIRAGVAQWWIAFGPGQDNWPLNILGGVHAGSATQSRLKIWHSKVSPKKRTKHRTRTVRWRAPFASTAGPTTSIRECHWHWDAKEAGPPKRKRPSIPVAAMLGQSAKAKVTRDQAKVIERVLLTHSSESKQKSGQVLGWKVVWSRNTLWNQAAIPLN